MFYWQNTEKGTQSEIDYLIVVGGKIIPVEVKASTQGKMQSLHLFLQKRASAFGIRTSLENVVSYIRNNRLIKVIPLYALSEIHLISFF